jgi:hypothetical protein
VIGKICDAYNHLRRAGPEYVAAKWIDAPAGAKLQQRALDDRRLALPRKAPQSHALEQPWHPSPMTCAGRRSAFALLPICRRS